MQTKSLNNLTIRSFQKIQMIFLIILLIFMYNSFIQFYQFVLQQQQIQHPGKRFTESEQNKQLSLYQDLNTVQSFKPMSYQTYANQQSINQLTRKVFQKLMTNKVLKQELEEHLQTELNIPTLQNQAVQHKALNNAFESFFKKKNIPIENKEMNALMSYFDYNEEGFTKTENITQQLYQETEKDFYVRKSIQSKRGPPILAQSGINLYSLTPKGNQTDTTDKMAMSSVDFKSTKLQNILNKFDERVHQGNNESLKVFRQFDIDGDGFVSQKDINSKLDQLAIFNENERKMFLDYIGLEKEKFLTYPEFAKRVKPNMANVSPYGELVVVPYNQSSKEEHQQLLNVVPSSTKSFMELRKNFLPEACGFQGKTRFSATPMHKNTFLNFQVPSDAGAYASNKERFHLQPLSKTQFQIDEKEKSSRMYENKIQKYLNDRDNYLNKLETEERLRELRMTNKFQQKGLAQWAYEHQCHLFQSLK